MYDFRFDPADKPTLYADLAAAARGLIHGESDPLMPLSAARWLADHLPQARLEVFHGAAHAPFLNSPERFAELLIEYCHAAPAHQATRP